jgi:hypothetical protein
LNNKYVRRLGHKKKKKKKTKTHAAGSMNLPTPFIDLQAQMEDLYINVAVDRKEPPPTSGVCMHARVKGQYL